MVKTIQKISHLKKKKINQNMEHNCTEICPKIASFLAKISDIFAIFSRPANFEKHKFVFWHPKIRILYQKIVFFKTNISERILNIYSTNFSYGKWMQEGLPNSTGSCELARECKIIKVLHNKKNSINLTFSGNRYIQTDAQIHLYLHHLVSVA